jgi:hypothetical protein
MLDSLLHRLINSDFKSLMSIDYCESKSNHNLTNMHDVLFVILNVCVIHRQSYTFTADKTILIALEVYTTHNQKLFSHASLNYSSRR